MNACLDCRFAFREPYEYVMICAHRNVATQDGCPNVILVRSDEGLCGEAGRWFEPRRPEAA